MNTSLDPSVPLTSHSFSAQATTVLGNLRAAIVGMFSLAPGGICKSYDVNKLLGVDARLSWQLFKLTGPGDPLSLAAHVPVPAAMKRLLTAATRHGIDAERIASVRKAFDDFEELVQFHAGDRSVFDTMTRSISDDEDLRQNDNAHRKAMFKGHRHFLGTEVEAYFATVINHPAAEGGRVDVGNLRGKIGMHRLRSDSEMVVDSTMLDGAEPEDKDYWHNAVDPVAARQFGAAIIPRFCSHPIPALKFREGPHGERVSMLAADGLGPRSAVDLVFGNVWRNMPLWLPDSNGIPGFRFNLSNNCPTVHLYIDAIFHRSLFSTADIKAEIFGLAPVLGTIDEIRRTQPQLFFGEKIARLPGGIRGAQIREAPQYLGMLEEFCDNLHWRMDDFEVFRLYVEYPIVGSVISLRFSQPR